ncbi:MAG: class I SAM-dependent methyltransferase [Candidatus Nanoarchaeia archaeon]
MDYVNCNLCGKNETKKLFTLYGLDVVTCKNCKLQYVNPRMSDEELVKIYNEDYYSNSGYFESALDHYGYDRYFEDKENIQLNFMHRLKQINKLRPGKGEILDIGCATGFFLDLARKHGWNARGLDLSKEAVEHARDKLKLDVKECTLADAKFKADTFDAVALYDVIEHLPDPKAEVENIVRILKKDGVFAVTTPNAGALLPRIIGKNWVEYKRVREHIYFFTNKTLKRMLEDCGLKVVRTETTGRIFELEGLFKNAMVQHKAFGIFYKIVKRLPFRRMKIPFNPRYKTTMYAIKK